MWKKQFYATGPKTARERATLADAEQAIETVPKYMARYREWQQRLAEFIDEEGEDDMATEEFFRAFLQEIADDMNDERNEDNGGGGGGGGGAKKPRSQPQPGAPTQQPPMPMPAPVAQPEMLVSNHYGKPSLAARRSADSAASGIRYRAPMTPQEYEEFIAVTFAIQQFAYEANARQTSFAMRHELENAAADEARPASMLSALQVYRRNEQRYPIGTKMVLQRVSSTNPVTFYEVIEHAESDGMPVLCLLTNETREDRYSGTDFVRPGERVSNGVKVMPQAYAGGRLVLPARNFEWLYTPHGSIKVERWNGEDVRIPSLSDFRLMQITADV